MYIIQISIDEEVIYSQESPNMVEFYRDFDWELDRFVEYRLPIKKPLLVFRIGTEIVYFLTYLTKKSRGGKIFL